MLVGANNRGMSDSFSLGFLKLGIVVRTTLPFTLYRGSAAGTGRFKRAQQESRSHQFAKCLKFGGEGGSKTNNPADQDAANVCNKLATYAVPQQTIANRTEALHELCRQGIGDPHPRSDILPSLSPKQTRRFGKYPAGIRTEAGPPNRNLRASAQVLAMTEA